MHSIPIAQKKEFFSETLNSGRFVIEPLFPGYGLTIGNALRRVLLSSLEGVAITFMRLKGVDHEFSALPGVKEDVVDIILNLKQIRFEVDGNFEEPIKMELKTKGVKVVTAGDFKKVAGVKIANPELIIANIVDAKGEFELEIWLERGHGYLPTEMMTTRDKEIGMIAVDAFFSPIKKVALDVENMRVGDMTNWDRLIMHIESDGTIMPEEALTKAAGILVEQFSFFVESKKIIKKEDATETEETALETETTEDSTIAEDKPKKRGRKKKEE
ncbi:DNA-directed RNA polymerase subunit alpha [Candidatus Kuenenbacteria bacterium CG23_combo_of_CG06-09_8_20_14_all_36_9]|uniref:DNA-directed RNA polymerase subunit alpha n=1 Tax=Candidatus Kuenenbacteria bacterium CG10_big_fil_rev_8_21_14_0_10_36_11 TaxID=1974618 RepID=A0A2M6WB96_9BACT|nr:MAG: DNA-directed RNA polymerase subunit alpha [Candidatus Kuenenbacteria bacterium CG23_combo_of_CG06-09_8_20_14_all_36_9]PIT90088.1 MAG: DNA-directed RNA polymerase subunit alpha [Candidatus Kuenenbacteria bacterium CG10_big_fil_rev_8_21_14_0_10_36_11]